MRLYIYIYMCVCVCVCVCVCEYIEEIGRACRQWMKADRQGRTELQPTELRVRQKFKEMLQIDSEPLNCTV